MIIVTGASQNHYYTLIQFITSFINNVQTQHNQLIIYNLGISDFDWNYLIHTFNKYNFIFKIFDYSKYPEWYSIQINAGEYAWKPAIIYETFIQFKGQIIVWMDAGNIITDNLNNLNNLISITKLHSGVTSGTIQQWTHPTVIQLLKPTNLNYKNRNGSCFGFDTSCEWICDFINEFYNLSTDKKYIAPQGSSRSNHRQDQALFTILYYKYQEKYNFKEWQNNVWNIFIGYTIHNDIGGSHNPS